MGKQYASNIFTECHVFYGRPPKFLKYPGHLIYYPAEISEILSFGPFCRTCQSGRSNREECKNWAQRFFAFGASRNRSARIAKYGSSSHSAGFVNPAGAFISECKALPFKGDSPLRGVCQNIAWQVFCYQLYFQKFGRIQLFRVENEGLQAFYQY